MQRNNIQAAGNVWPDLSIKTEKRKPNNTSGLRGTFSSIGRVTLRSEPSQPAGNFEAPEMRDVPSKPISRGRGVHPGAGVPMATLCAQLAVEEMTKDQTSISTFPQMATHGGTLTDRPDKWKSYFNYSVHRFSIFALV